MSRFNHSLKLAALAALLFAMAVSPADAAAKKEDGTKPLGNFGYWRTYIMTEHDRPVCYMTLAARFPNSARYHRSDALLTITHRPGEGSKDVISYTAGYNYKPESSADLSIGKEEYNLFTAGDTAWSRDAATDHKIAAAIRKSPSLTIRGTPGNKRINSYTDKFSLKGADAAYLAVSKACGVEVTPLPSAKKSTKVAAKAKPKKH